jgi:hypothetical protein|nr:YIP1 family protein [Candidatus Krumholzibacteria bacterium]
MNDHLPQEELAPEVVAGDPLLQRFADLITKPGRLMENVGRKTHLWLPYLLVFVVMSGFMWLVAPIMNPEQIEMSRDSKLMQMVPEEVRQEQYEQALNPSPGRRALQASQAGLFVVIQMMLLALLLGFFVKLSGGTGKMVQSMGVVAWAGLIPMVLGPLLTLPIILQTESFFGTSIGLAALLPDGDPSSLLYKVLYMFGDFFTWWGVFLLVIGYQKVFGLSRSASATTVVLIWFVAVLFASAPMLFLM